MGSDEDGDWLSELQNRHAELLDRDYELRFRPALRRSETVPEESLDSSRERIYDSRTKPKPVRERELIEEELANIYAEFVDRACDHDATYQSTIKRLLSAFQHNIPSHVIADVVGCSAGHARRFEWDTNQNTVSEKQWSRSQRENQAPPALVDRVNDRDNNCCVRCESTNQTVVHHIIPVATGGSAVLQNLAVLCKRCHRDAHDGVINSGEVIYDSLEQFWLWASGDDRWDVLNEHQGTLDEFRS